MATHSSLIPWRGAWWTGAPGGRKESDMTEQVTAHSMAFCSLASGPLAFDWSPVDLKQMTASYFSSKDGFIWDEQRTEIQGLQPWQAMCKFLLSQGGRTVL